jgi:dTDP-4-dehydrorhamnose 3,5-epimerase
VRIVPTPLAGLFVIEPQRIDDARGFFTRTWCRRDFESHGLNTDLAQCSIAHNHAKGTLRGMHFQAEPHAEVKLVRVTFGSLFDVAIDLRQHSPTFCKWFGVELSADNLKALYIPKGFAHGYITLTDNTQVAYQMSEFYAPDAGRGVRYNDPAFGIDWPGEVRIINDRDANYADFATTSDARKFL